MIRVILSSIFFVSILSSDVILEVMFYDDYNITISDTPMEGESEKEGQEDTKEVSKINVNSLFDLYEASDRKLQSNTHFYFQLSEPHLEHFSPPPEYS